MKKIKFILVGGFLGAGKTTALCRLARYYIDEGLRVGLITNDQANNLVDTYLVKIEGFNVEEIPGGCFCCKFNDLVLAADKLITKVKPDVILAEPVGSCTDLVATVIKPLKFYHKDSYEISPYTVLLDPKRAKDMIISGALSGFSRNVAYIFMKQLEESDIVALNKIDTLKPAQAASMLNLLKKKFPKSKVIGISSRTGKGFDHWIKIVRTMKGCGRNILDVDYDIYASGEAELGWLNFIAELSAKAPFSTEKLLKALTLKIKSSLNDIPAEIAHLKLALSTGLGNSLIHLTRSSQGLEFFKRESGKSSSARLIVNARVHTDPKLLCALVTGALNELCKKEGVGLRIKSKQYFRPGRPVPVHRFV
ncbi:MAG: cobalamin biosynthesis protein P47K [Candidatus Omnitrophica bacterium]|nr:cobalamin biosynthesis protein P47K [Candidatus Omnitrophota bacterium]MBU1923973.1 cobalamin biosynthesis protein P47K [Candidatus Omnitrophota bacterium]